MKKINWKVRFANKAFWAAFIPAVLLLIQMVAKACGVDLDLTEIQANILGVVDALFGVLVILGVVIDPTTNGVGDSKRALTYSHPAE